MRIKSNKVARNGGWIHRLENGGRTNGAAVRVEPRPTTPTPTQDWERLQGWLTDALWDSRMDRLVQSLGCPKPALSNLCVGYHSDQDAYTLPMRDAGGALTGFQVRAATGKKWSIKGSRMGLFFDPAADRENMVFVCEGFSDTAAVLGVGLAAVGRPGCLACVEETTDFVYGLNVVVIADRGDPGQDGAWQLAKQIRRAAKSVRIVTPPVRHKDARAWVNSGATRDDILEMVDARNAI